jgi:integrase
LYYRKGRGWYADFRDLGGKQEALKPPGSKFATHDEQEAQRLLTQRLDDLKRGIVQSDATLVAYSKRHLALKALHRRASTVQRDEECLRCHVIRHFGDVPLSQMTVAELNDFVLLRKQEGAAAQTILQGAAAQTILHELHALSNLYKRAVSEGVVQDNPVTKLSEKPSPERAEAVWLEIGEAARLLNAAQAMDNEPRRAMPYLRPILAAFLLTGARRGEVFGLEVTDIDRQHGVVHIRPNAWRQLKRPQHRRFVPLWPQLDEILTAHQERFDRAGGLLFPSPRCGMLRDIRAGIQSAAKRAKIMKHLTPHVFRHTYASTRLQTLDHGAPVSPYTVMKELGHRSIKLIEDTYGHLLTVRPRLSVVEYREAEVTVLSVDRSA